MFINNLQKITQQAGILVNEFVEKACLISNQPYAIANYLDKRDYLKKQLVELQLQAEDCEEHHTDVYKKVINLCSIAIIDTKTQNLYLTKTVEEYQKLFNKELNDLKTRLEKL